jgi:hypothetical protein
MDPNLSIIPTAQIFEQVQFSFFDRTIFEALNHIIPLKLEDSDCYSLLQEIPIQFRIVDEDGFLKDFINNHTNSIIKFRKKSHKVYATPNIALYENVHTIFRQWSKLFEIPALTENLKVVENFLASRRLGSLTPNQVILYLSTMLSDCGWTTQVEIPPFFQKDVSRPHEISRILWGYVSSNITRMQNQEIMNIDEFMRNVKIQIGKITISVDQIFQAILKGILLFMRLENTRIFDADHLTFSLLLCNIRLRDTNSSILGNRFWDALSDHIDKLDYPSYSMIMDVVSTIYDTQFDLSDRERSRLIVFG